MEVAPAVSQSTEVPVEPPTAFRAYTAEINRRLVCSWRQADWRPGDELEMEVAFQPAGAGTVVTINVRGWDRIAGGEELGRGYGSGARELLGWYAEAAGSATIHGLPYRELPDPVRQVGALLEASGFHPGRTARNHLLVAATAAGLPPGRADQVLAQVGLADAARRRVGGFSLGTRQRLGLAATALLGDPQVLVLDEPANGLDPQGVHWLRGFLRQLADQGRTVLVSSHVLAEVAQTVDQVVILAGGRLVTQAPLAALTDQARGAVRVRSADTGALRDLLAAHGATVELAGPDELAASGVTDQQVGRMAAAVGIAIYEMGFERANLEEVFLQLTAPQGDTS